METIPNPRQNKVTDLTKTWITLDYMGLLEKYPTLEDELIILLSNTTLGDDDLEKAA